jgi:hypothetical protein
MEKIVTMSAELFRRLFIATDAITQVAHGDIYTDVNENNERHQVGVLKANATSLEDDMKAVVAQDATAAEIAAAVTFDGRGRLVRETRALIAQSEAMMHRMDADEEYRRRRAA